MPRPLGYDSHPIVSLGYFATNVRALQAGKLRRLGALKSFAKNRSAARDETEESRPAFARRRENRFVERLTFLWKRRG